MQAKELKDDIALLSYNIDTNILRTEEGEARDAFPEWRANNRVYYIIEGLNNIINSKHPDIIHIQEGRKFITKFGDEVDSITKLVDFLKFKKYEILIQSYNESGGEKAFKYITAFDPQKFALIDNYLKYFTKTPDKATLHPDMADKTQEEKYQILAEIKNNNFGLEWERGTFICKLQSKITGKNIYSFNVHMDIGLEARKKSSELLTIFAEEIAIKDPEAKIIILGDFNTFPDLGGPEQLHILTSKKLNGKNLLKEATENIHLPNDNNKFSSTFFPFPYDPASNFKKYQEKREDFIKLSPQERRTAIIQFFEEECQALEGHLDRVLQRGYPKKNVDCELIPVTVGTGPKNYTEEELKKHIVSCTKNENRPAFASDHQAVYTKFMDKIKTERSKEGIIARSQS